MPLLEELLTSLRAQAAQTSLLELAKHLLASAALCAALGRAYAAFGTAVSDRRRFARTLALVGLGTTLIVTVMQTSLALSLGLIAAVSLVRVRGAVKEPDEVACLFAAVAVGLAAAGRQAHLAAAGTAALVLVLYLNHRAREAPAAAGVVLTVSSAAPEQAGAARIVDVLRRRFGRVELRRLDEAHDGVRAVFVLPPADQTALDGVEQELRALSETVQVASALDQGTLADVGAAP